MNVSSASGRGPSLVTVALLLGCAPDRGNLGQASGSSASEGGGSGEASGGSGEAGEASGSTGATGASGGEAGEGGVRLDVGGEEGGSAGSEGGTPPPGCSDLGDAQTNQGCEFWAVDLPQPWWAEGDNPTPPENGQYAVVVANASSNQPAQVSIYQGAGTAAIDAATVAVDDLHVFTLPALNVPSRGSSTSGMAYRIVTDVPVTAYQFNTLEQTSARFSADASLLIPSHVLQTDYAAFTGDALLSEGDVGAFVAVVATEDGTTVDLFPTYALQDGAPATGIVLARGQVYAALSKSAGSLIPTPGEGNLTGSRVVANKPVAVFAGNVASREPVGALTDYVCCGDHMEEQMLPLAAWGSSYMAAPPVDPNTPGAESRAAYRVMGGFDGTTLSWNPAPPPGAPTTIDAYVTAYFVTNVPFTVTGSQPFGIAQFTLGAQSSGIAGLLGDPSSIVLPAQDQLQDSYVFLIPPTFEQNWVTVVRPVGTATTLDGAAATEAPKPVGNLDGTDYESLQIPLLEGPHRISGDLPFQITVFGFGQQISYAFPGGSGLKSITEPPPPPVG